MRNVWTIYRREFAAYFNSPIAYIFIVGFLAIMGFLFFIFSRFFSQQNPDLRVYFELFMPIVFILFIPAITMRLWSEEKKQGTLEMLMTLPVNSWEVVAAKFLAAYTIIAVTLVLTLIVPISVAMVVENMDAKALFANYLGALLIAGIYIAIGSWISALTKDQVVAFVLATLACAIVCFVGYPHVVDWFNQNLGGLGGFLVYFGVYFHNQKFAQGLVGAVDVVYALGMMGLFLGLNNFAVESRKY